MGTPEYRIIDIHLSYILIAEDLLTGFIKGIIKSTTLLACLQNCMREFSDYDELTLKQFEEKCVDILNRLIGSTKGHLILLFLILGLFY